MRNCVVGCVVYIVVLILAVFCDYFAFLWFNSVDDPVILFVLLCDWRNLLVR